MINGRSVKLWDFVNAMQCKPSVWSSVKFGIIIESHAKIHEIRHAESQGRD